MTTEMQNIRERQKKETAALQDKYHRDMTALKVKHEQELSRIKQKSFVNSLSEFMDYKIYVLPLSVQLCSENQKL